MGQVERKEKTPMEKGSITPIRSNLELMPSRLMERLEHMMERWEPFALWSRWPEGVVAKVPAINLYEEGGNLVVETELPGVRKEDIDIKLTGDVLTISGKREQEKKEERRDYFRLERSSSAVSRTIQLPCEVQGDKMTAELKDGVLTIRAPRTEAAKASTRQVPVT
jgi:HSP20 family protein